MWRRGKACRQITKWRLRRAGNRHRAGLDACDLSGRLFCAANSRAYLQAVHFAQQKDGNKAVLHRHSRNLESCAPISFDFGAQCNFGGIFRSVYSEVYILVLGIYYKLQTFIYLPANGIVQGMRPLIGYNYGAGENKRVSQIYKIVLCMSGIIMLLGTVICLLIPGQLMGLFTHTEATIQTGKTALRIIGAGFIVSAVSVTSSGALEGLGKGIPSLLISLCRYVVVIIPTAFLLSSIFGAVGVWNAFWITEAITAIISICVYYKAISQSQRSQSTVK